MILLPPAERVSAILYFATRKSQRLVKIIPGQPNMLQFLL